MSLTRFLPVPSDRMGIIWSLLPIENTVILEYGPAGTTHFSIGLFSELGANQENHLFTTHMSEDDVVMGDTKRLEEAIVEIDKNLCPKVIFVVASSVAAVIGSDIKGVCNYMQEKVQAKLLSFEQGGFRGDYSSGIKETYKLLAKEVPLDNPKPQTDKVNLIGFSMGSYRAASDRAEIERLLDKAFGIKIGAYLCGKTAIEDIENMGGALANLVIRDEGVDAAEILRKRFETPYIKGAPYGYKGTLKWLEEISEVIGKPINPECMEEINNRIEDTVYYAMNTMMLKKDKPFAALIGEYQTITGIGKFLAEMGFPNQKKICLHSLKNIKNPDESVLYYKSEKDRMDELENLHRCIILGDDPSMSFCAKDNVFLRISMPVVRGAQIAEHLPIMGIRGADFITEYLEEYLQMLR